VPSVVDPVADCQVVALVAAQLEEAEGACRVALKFSA
jgi:hypothetical protein